MDNRFNGATLRTRGIQYFPCLGMSYRGKASMGPRLGRVEYNFTPMLALGLMAGFNGATLRTRGIPNFSGKRDAKKRASMGPRLGRVEYAPRRRYGKPKRKRASMGPRLGRVEYGRDLYPAS